MNLMSTTLMAALAAMSIPATADAGAWRDRLDRMEDRVDRRESYIDEQVDYGPRDVIVDRFDRIESRRDRLGYDRPSRFDRHERRSWRRLWGNN